MKRLLGCTGKVPYFTQREAKTIIRNWKFGGTPSVYHCRHCDLWHITSMISKEYKKIKKRINEKHNT